MTAQRVIQLWAQVREGLLETIDRFTDRDLLFVALKNGYSVGEIIQHIAHEEYGEIQYGLTFKLDEFPAKFPEEEYGTIDSSKALLARVHNETTEYLRSIDDSDLAREFEAQWGERRPLVDFIVHVMEHEIHHRGELSLILGLLGREGFDA